MRPEAHLTSLNIRLLELMNKRDYDNAFFDCLFPDVHVEIDGASFQGRKAYIEGYKSVADDSPDLQVAITNASAIVDEPTNRGQVVLHVTLTAFYDTATRLASERAATVLSCWQRDEQKWTCYAYFLVYGIQEFD